jgi:hypothetical protein
MNTNLLFTHLSLMHQLCRNSRTGQLKYSIHKAWFSSLFVLVFMAAAPVYGQGGPPMIADDPFTPENGHWENNISVQFTGTTASKEIEIPAVDINYGYGIMFN